MSFRVGDLSKKSGLTVRTLHHYDSIGLLSPSLRSSTGTRNYGHSDLIRLHRIQALKHLGYSLAEIRKNLDEPDIDPRQIIATQIEALREQSRRAQELSERLEYIHAHLKGGGETAASDWLNLLEMMMMYKNTLTEAEMKSLRNPKEGKVSEISEQWIRLVAEADLAIASKMPIESEEAQALSWRWIKLVIAMTSNNAMLASKLKGMQERESRAQEILGIDPVKFTWIGQAFAHARTRLFSKYLTPEQSARILRRQLDNPAHIDAWPRLMAQVRSQMESDAAVESDPVQKLMAYWRQLFRDSYCGEDSEMEARVRLAFISEPDLMLGVGVDDALMNYVQKAMLYLHRPTPMTGDSGPKPSALMVAMQRAAHQMIDQPLVLTDPLALRILSASEQQELKANLGRYQDPMSRGLRTSLVVRSRVAEDQWLVAKDRGVQQCVILGAGLDTFAHRRVDDQCKVFEVDLPTTQRWKQERLATANIEIAKSLKFVPVDFEHDELGTALMQAGFEAEKPAYFIWLGVVMYLDQRAIDATLKYIASCGNGTQVIFDYVVPASTLPTVMRAPIEMMAKYLAEAGEPWKSYLEPAQLESRMLKLGFTSAHTLEVGALNKSYLANRSDAMQMTGLTRIRLASVGETA